MIFWSLPNAGISRPLTPAGDCGADLVDTVGAAAFDAGLFPVGLAGIHEHDKSATNTMETNLFINNTRFRHDLNQETLIVFIPVSFRFTIHATSSCNYYLARQIIELQSCLPLVRKPELEKRKSTVITELVVKRVVVF